MQPEPVDLRDTEPAAPRRPDRLSRFTWLHRAGRPSWSASAPVTRRLLGCAGVLLVACALVGTAAAHTSPRHRELVVNDKPAVPPDTDAAGCPVDVTCSLAVAPASVLAAVTAAYPTAKIAVSSSVRDTSSGRTYRISVNAVVSESATLVVDGQCLPYSKVSGPVSFAGNDYSSTDLAGNAVVNSSSLRATIPGSQGCVLSAELDQAGDGTIYQDALRALSNDPRTRLAP